MNIFSSPWQINNSEDLPLFGNVHIPAQDQPRGVVIMTHGFLGYKDYGMFPFLAQSFADAGFITHRYNLAHSGMTNQFETFERPDLFENDTWNHQVADIESVIAAVNDGTLEGKGLPIILWGHSRGGVSTLLAAGRRFRKNQESGQPNAVITVSAPDSTCRMSEEVRVQVRDKGFIEVTSNRTGQTLRINRRWLDELEADPEGHDVLGCAHQIRCPVLAIHGEEDPTVDPTSAPRIADAVKGGNGRASSMLIANANHVFNTPNPMPVDSAPSAELRALKAACLEFARKVVDAG